MKKSSAQCQKKEGENSGQLLWVCTCISNLQKTLPSNWRPISLQPTIYKIYAAIQARRLASSAIIFILPENFGVSKGLLLVGRLC